MHWKPTNNARAELESHPHPTPLFPSISQRHAATSCLVPATTPILAAQSQTEQTVAAPSTVEHSHSHLVFLGWLADESSALDCGYGKASSTITRLGRPHIIRERAVSAIEINVFVHPFNSSLDSSLRPPEHLPRERQTGMVLPVSLFISKLLTRID